MNKPIPRIRPILRFGSQRYEALKPAARYWQPRASVATLTPFLKPMEQTLRSRVSFTPVNPIRRISRLPSLRRRLKRPTSPRFRA